MKKVGFTIKWSNCSNQQQIVKGYLVCSFQKRPEVTQGGVIICLSPHVSMSSWQNSPASPFRPTISVSYAPSIHTCSYYDSDGEYLQNFSHPSPSTWHLLQMNAPECKRYWDV